LPKSEIREHVRALRRSIPADYRAQAGRKAADIFVNSPLFLNHIACYMAMPDELDTMPIIRAIWQAGKKCYLPVLSGGQVLSFVLYEEGDRLVANRYKILEPVSHKQIAADELDVVLVPLVAFDNAGNRLGTGGGFYDRTFSFLAGKTNRKPVLIGLGYDIQKVDELPRESFDVPLDGIITEKYFTL